MAGKTKERQTARFMYVEQGKEGKEIAALLKVSENTVSNWVNANNEAWKREREARINSTSQRAENIKRVISNLTEQTLSLQEQRTRAILKSDMQTVKEIDLACVGIGDQVSKYTKALMLLDKQNRITLDAYLEVMDDVFKSAQVYDNKLYMQTLNFQEQHVQHVSAKLG